MKEINDKNHAICAKNDDIITEAHEVYEIIGEPECARANRYPESELMRQQYTIPKLVLEGADELPDMQDNTKPDVLYKDEQNSHSKDDILPVLQSLNATQMKIFYHVRVDGHIHDPLHNFITGGA